jgi:hypothetical protein
MKTLKQLTIYALSLLILSGCMNDEEDFDRYWIDIATVENPENSTKFFLRTDDNTLLWTETSVFSAYKPANGQRVIANYSLLSDKRATGLYDYDIQLNDVYEVLTKGIFAVTPATQDSIGSDSIYVEDKDIWIGSKYLNVEFLYQGYSKTHFINLVSDTSKTYNDDKIHLEFRHNANNDLAVNNRWGIVSFDLSSLENNLADSVNLVIHVNLPNKAADTTFERTYHYNAAPAGVKKKNLRSSFLQENNSGLQ